MRMRNSVGFKDVGTSIGKPGKQLTTLRHDDSGIYLGVGTSAGQVIIYDIRFSHPLIVENHQCGTKIIDIKFQRSTRKEVCDLKVISSNTKTIKIWKMNDGQQYTSIKVLEKISSISDVCVYSSLGLIMIAIQ